MYVESHFSITREQFDSMAPASLIERVKDWINEKDPIALQHPHGFWVVLLNKSEMEEWRLHYWPRGCRKITGMPAKIHTHDRVVESRIMFGELMNIVYSSTNVELDGWPVYEVAYFGDKYVQDTSNVLKKSGMQTKLVSKCTQILKVGNRYRIEAHLYHEAVVAKDVATATIVCMHSRVPGTAKVLGLASCPNEIVFTRIGRRARELLQDI